MTGSPSISRPATAATTERSDTSSNNLSTFTCFKNLATELQIMVWEEAARTVQMVEIEITDNGPRARNHHTRALRLTCQAARDGVKKQCTTIFEGALPSAVYVKLDIDVVMLKDEKLLQKLSNQSKPFFQRFMGFHGIQNLAFYGVSKFNSNNVISTSMGCRGLKTLYAVGYPSTSTRAVANHPTMFEYDPFNSEVECSVQELRSSVEQKVKTLPWFAFYLSMYHSGSPEPEPDVHPTSPSFLEHPLVKSFKAPKVFTMNDVDFRAQFN